MTKDLKNFVTLPQALRAAHNNIENVTSGSPLPLQIQAYRNSAVEGSKDALEKLKELKDKYPKNVQVALSVLDAEIEFGNRSGINSILSHMEKLDTRKIYWFRRFKRAWKKEHIMMRNVRLTLDKVNVSPQEIKALATGYYENKEAYACHNLLSERDRVIELGAGLGYIALSSLKNCKGIKFWHSVEANPNLIPLIQDSQSQNNCQFSLENSVWGLNNGTTDFYICKNGFRGSSALDINLETKRISVKCVNAIERIKKLNPNVLIMDIEGGEYDILDNIDLQGLTKLIVEFHPQNLSDKRHSQTLSRLLSNGFNIVTALSTKDVICFQK